MHNKIVMVESQIKEFDQYLKGLIDGGAPKSIVESIRDSLYESFYDEEDVDSIDPVMNNELSSGENQELINDVLNDKSLDVSDSDNKEGFMQWYSSESDKMSESDKNMFKNFALEQYGVVLESVGDCADDVCDDSLESFKAFINASNLSNEEVKMFDSFCIEHYGKGVDQIFGNAKIESGDDIEDPTLAGFKQFILGSELSSEEEEMFNAFAIEHFGKQLSEIKGGLQEAKQEKEEKVKAEIDADEVAEIETKGEHEKELAKFEQLFKITRAIAEKVLSPEEVADLFDEKAEDVKEDKAEDEVETSEDEVEKVNKDAKALVEDPQNDSETREKLELLKKVDGLDAEKKLELAANNEVSKKDLMEALKIKGLLV